MVYVGQTRAKKLIARLAELGFGEMTVRGEWPPRRHPWALDNGAFRDWKAGTEFDFEAWEKALDIAATHHCKPDFIVAPDCPGQAAMSILRSRNTAYKIKQRWAFPQPPVYLAVQDGMDYRVVRESEFDGIFVGGTLEWKLETAAQWVGAAHAMDKPCHVGRVGTQDRVRWCRQIGADSIDSCLPLFSTENLDRFIQGFIDEPPKKPRITQHQMDLGIGI